METSEFIKTVETLHRDARERGLFFQHSEDEQIRGRDITVDGRPLVSFASCSYLGLEHEPSLIEGVHDAVDRYGTQFSVSRGFLSVPLYEELETLLTKLFGAPTLATASTTLGHLSFFDAMVNEQDAVLLDHQVHASVQRAASLAKSGGAHLELVHHERLERALERAEALSRECRTVWFCTDGVTSMYGDLAPVRLLDALLEVAPNIRLYVDDAHGMSWAGEHGRGSYLSRRELGDRTYLATSLNKAFSGSGGAIVFPNAEDRDKVRMCGGTMTFSGPIQPPMLGACVASARLHLSDAIIEHQARLAARVQYMNARCIEAELPLLVENESPIFFIRCGLPKVSAEVAHRVARDGSYVNISMYPTVPMRRSGIRISVTAAHSEAQIDRVVASLREHVPAVLREEGISEHELKDLFASAVVSGLLEGEDRTPETFAEALGRFGDTTSRPTRTRKRSGTRLTAPLQVSHHRTIEDVDRDEWDAMLGTVGCISYEAQRTVEALVAAAERPEDRWEFDYVVVRGGDGAPLAATVFTTLLQKDDMLMRAGVSRAVEARREDDPYFLTSKVVITGTGLSEGDHVFVAVLPEAHAALRRLLDEGERIRKAREATALVVRDLPGDDGALSDFFLDEGFVRIEGLDTHRLAIDWPDPSEIVSHLPHRRYRRVARRTLERKDEFEVRVVDRDATPEALRHLHGLYENVAEKKLRLNTFRQPDDSLSHLVRSPAWEVVALHLLRSAGGPEDGAPVAFFAAHVFDGHYAPLLCGLDYRFMASHSTYKQMVYRVLVRAHARGCAHVHLGMDADLEKRRWGAKGYPTAIYVQSFDHYNAAVLREMVANAT